MKMKKIHIEQGDAIQQLMPILEGKVFHVSKIKYFSQILELGKILPNENMELDTSFGSSKNSLFRNMGCVSFFDYRNVHSENFKKHSYKCLPTAPLTSEEGLAIFFLNDTKHHILISSNSLRKEDLKMMVVPHVEAGYPGAIDLSLIDEIAFVTMSETESSELEKLLMLLDNLQE